MQNKGFLAERYNAAAEKQSRTLYHCIPVVPEGDEIRTSANYGARIPQSVWDKLSINGSDVDGPNKTPLTFAATTLGKALAFGFIKGEDRFLNHSVEGSDAEVLFVCNREAAMKREMSVTVFSFSDEGFADLETSARQSVSNKPVPFSKTKKVVEAKNAEDMMRAGLQILSFKETREELGIETMWPPEPGSLAGMQDSELYATLSGMIKEGRVVWENQARNINPSPDLAKKLDIQLPTAKPAAHKFG